MVNAYINCLEDAFVITKRWTIISSSFHGTSTVTNMYGLLTKCEVKMAGYWPSSFFAWLWTETKSRSINAQKKKRGQYSAILTEQTWSIKDLLYGFWWNFACGIQRVVPSGQDGSILPAPVANHSARFGSSCLILDNWLKNIYVTVYYLRSFLVSGDLKEF